MALYRISYSLWRIEAENAREAKQKLCKKFKDNPEDFFHVTNADLYDDRKGVLRRLLFG